MNNHHSYCKCQECRDKRHIAQLQRELLEKNRLALAMEAERNKMRVERDIAVENHSAEISRREELQRYIDTDESAQEFQEIARHRDHLVNQNADLLGDVLKLRMDLAKALEQGRELHQIAETRMESLVTVSAQRDSLAKQLNEL